jgi:hypothetical protein
MCATCLLHKGRTGLIAGPEGHSPAAHEAIWMAERKIMVRSTRPQPAKPEGLSLVGRGSIGWLRRSRRLDESTVRP